MRILLLFFYVIYFLVIGIVIVITNPLFPFEIERKMKASNMNQAN